MTITQTLTAPPAAATPVRSMNKVAFNAFMESLLAWYSTQNTELSVWTSQTNDIADTISGLVAGTTSAVPYTFSTTTTDADPGAGFLRLGSATQNAATVMRVDLFGSDGESWTNVIDSWDDSTSSTKGTLHLYSLANPTKWLVFSVTSIASPAGYRNITVAPLASSETNPFANGDGVALKFTAKGDKGDTGSGGVADMLTTTRTSNTILAAADKGKFFQVTGASTFTQTFNACSSLGSGWWCIYQNAGTGTVTLDANLSETINGATTLVLGTDDTYLLVCDGTSLRAIGLGYSGEHEVVVYGGNGHGSSGPCRRFSSIHTNVGSAITYADSASNGASFTVNETGNYAMTYTDVGGAIGLSLNAVVTSSILGITSPVSRLVVASVSGTDIVIVSVVVKLLAGDIVRTQTNGGQSSTDNSVMFRIRKVGNA